MAKNPLAELLEKIEAAKRQAKDRGMLLQTVAVAELPPAPESDPDVKPVAPRTHVLNAVAQYHEAIKKLTRQSLEARYRRDVGEAAPSVARVWLIEKMARKFQVEAYMQYEGEVPASVRRYDRIFLMQRPRILTEDEIDDEDDEPSKADRKFDPTLRVKAKVQLPFSGGKAAQLFQLIATAPNGITYNALVLLLEKINDWARAKAESKAQKAFTKWVDQGLVELI